MKIGDTLPPTGKAKLRLPVAEGNKTEVAFGLWLFGEQQRGDILWYAFEPFKLQLGKGAWYTPDFAAMNRDRSIEFFEVKGFWREAARVRIKVAASKYPFFTFTAVKKDKGLGWIYETIGGKPAVLKV